MNKKHDDLNDILEWPVAKLTIRSAKAKGRRLQQFVRDCLLKAATKLEPDDIRSTSMGVSGEDIQLSPAARKVYPYSIECKNVEKLNIWEAIRQSKYNANGHTPLVIFKKNGHEPYAAIPFSHLLTLIGPKDETED